MEETINVEFKQRLKWTLGVCTKKKKTNVNKSRCVTSFILCLQASNCGSHLENELRGSLRCGSR